ncbi:hypothetical protein RYX36_001587 [Vicia faba]
MFVLSIISLRECLTWPLLKKIALVVIQSSKRAFNLWLDIVHLNKQQEDLNGKLEYFQQKLQEVNGNNRDLIKLLREAQKLYFNLNLQLCEAQKLNFNLNLQLREAHKLNFNLNLQLREAQVKEVPENETEDDVETQIEVPAKAVASIGPEAVTNLTFDTFGTSSAKEVPENAVPSINPEAVLTFGALGIPSALTFGPAAHSSHRPPWHQPEYSGMDSLWYQRL